MAEQQLRDPHIARRFRDVVREGVSERVWAKRMANAGALSDLAHQASGRLLGPDVVLCEIY